MFWTFQTVKCNFILIVEFFTNLQKHKIANITNLVLSVPLEMN